MTTDRSVREQAMTDWVGAQLSQHLAIPRDQLQYRVSMLAGDASFRRYYRATANHNNWVVMDAPTDKEDSRPFVAVQQVLATGGNRVPAMIAQDLDQGFFLLEDLGDRLLSTVLTADTVDALYSQAINQLIHLQYSPVASYPLPSYDADRLTTEMRLFDQWFLPWVLGRQVDAAELQLLQGVYQLLTDSAQSQPQALVHRDYHSRNLIVLDELTDAQQPILGIIDFQDAVIGSVTYDLVSLLRDAYVRWPAAQVAGWVKVFWERQQILGHLGHVSLVQLQHWFDWMGAQRHLKVLGIFVRLSQRDGKSGYLKDLPLVLEYLLEECKPYPELGAFVAWLETTVVPAFAERQS